MAEPETALQEPLAPGMRRVGAVLRRLPGSSVVGRTPEQVTRAGEVELPRPVASLLLGSAPPGVAVRDRVAEGVPVRIYSPGRRPRVPGPLVVFLHGGGFVSGGLRNGDWMCGAVVRALGGVVVSAGYRLAPRFPFPAAVEDCWRVLRWAGSHAEPLGTDGRLGVMGESAGGNLAAVVALMARDDGGPALLHQALLYPSTGAGDTASRRRNADAMILTAAEMQRYGQLYGGDPDDWRVSPIRAASLRGLPPATVIVAGHDPLHDDGVRYGRALEAAGVDVRLAAFPAMPHGFLSLPRFARDARAAMTTVVSSQRAALSTSAEPAR